MRARKNHGETVTGTIANLRFGDPSKSCTGKGICKMDFAKVGDPIPPDCVRVSISSANDKLDTAGDYINYMVITLDLVALTTLQKIDPYNYNLITTQPDYDVDLGALPFTIDDNIANVLWATDPNLELAADILPSIMSWDLHQTGNPVTKVDIAINTIFLEIDDIQE